MSTIILGIESSCDDTSAAVVKDGYLLSNVVASQAVHEAYGGVVPELASRAHQQNIVPVVHEALKRAEVAKEDVNPLFTSCGMIIKPSKAVTSGSMEALNIIGKFALLNSFLTTRTKSWLYISFFLRTLTA